MQRLSLLMIWVCFSSFSFAIVNITLEQGPAWQGKNEFNISGSDGTRVDLAQTEKGPNYSVRLEGRWQATPHHAFKLLFAPYSSTTSFYAVSNFKFLDHTFSGNQILNANYKFNSYRLSYLYTFNPESRFRYTLGVTAKVRDAQIRISDGITVKESPNLGFVPLLHFELDWQIDDKLTLSMIADALAAPQGRAEDVLLKAVYNLNEKWRIYGGYRTLEGGADNDRVYTFAWIHYAVLGIESDFNWF